MRSVAGRFVLCLVFLAPACAAGLPALLIGQDPTATEREAMYAKYWGFAGRVVGGGVEPHWLEDGSRFWYVEGAPDSATILLVDPAANTSEPLFDTERLRGAVSEALGYGAPYDGLPFSEIEFDEEPSPDDPGSVRFVVDEAELTIDLDDYSVRATGRSSEMREQDVPRLVREAFPATSADLYEVRSPDGRWFARDDERDLWLRARIDDRLERLTSDGEEWFSWTVADAEWSPSSMRLAAQKIDNRHVDRVPLVHWLKTNEEVEWWPFTRAGGPLPRPELHILDVISKTDVIVDVGEDPEIYLSILQWTDDGSELLFLRMNREHDRLDLMAADPETGASRVILTETQSTFIKGIDENPSWRDLATPLADGERFLWISERDGWDHLYLYDLEGTLLRRLTSGEWPVSGIEAVDEENGWVYFRGQAETELDPALGAPRVYDTHLYRVRLDGSGLTRLSEGSGNHAFAVSPSREFFVDVYSSVTEPPRAELRRTDGRHVRTLSVADIGLLDELSWVPPEPFVAKAADGETDLYGVLFKPWDFDPSRSYPVVEYIYGGPQTINHPREFTDGVLPMALAQLGYVTVVLDARGTPGRGKAFQDVVHGNFGRNEIPDHVAALRGAAESRPWMNLDRVGIVGGSWGGYMTIRALVLAPGFYDAGAALYPVVEMYDHMAQAIEPYMGIPRSRPDAFAYGASTDRVDQIQGRLMLMHGTQDVNATFSATMKMVDAMTKAGKPYDLVVFPEVNHSLTPVQTYFVQTIARFFTENIDPGPDPVASTGGRN
ncbi:MAG: S9 family peptidase [Gemmatimonadetes bacterium]|nr:S9 family peptidase [Gemmatimonadota bacterium]